MEEIDEQQAPDGSAVEKEDAGKPDGKSGDLAKAIERHGRALQAKRDAEAKVADQAKTIGDLQKQVEELSANDSKRALELAQSKLEKLEQQNTTLLEQLASEQRGRKIETLRSRAQAESGADPELFELAFNGAIVSAPLGEVLEQDDWDADAALKALKKHAPVLFKEPKRATKPDGYGAVPPNSQPSPIDFEAMNKQNAEDMRKLFGG